MMMKDEGKLLKGVEELEKTERLKKCHKKVYCGRRIYKALYIKKKKI